MDCRDEQARRDADGFDRVIGWRSCSIGEDTERLSEDGDEPWGNFQKRFSRIRSQRCKRFKPRFRSALFVEFLLFNFRGNPNFGFYRQITQGYKMPRLQVSSAWRRARRTRAILDHVARPWTIREIAYR